MVEQPGQDREPNPDDANDAQLPGPEDGPVTSPRQMPGIGEGAARNAAGVRDRKPGLGEEQDA